MNAAMLAPSILSADLTRLRDQIIAVEKGGADLLHVDIMDGHFVPNMTFGPNIVRALKSISNLPLDVHLMIERPENYVDEFIEAGASIVSVHYEATVHLHRLVQRIRSKGAKAGVALNPATPVSVLEEILPDLDMVLLMSVNPGFGGQKFIPASAAKVEKLRAMCDRLGVNPLIEMDGGIGVDNAKDLRRAGVDVFVAGNAVFGAPQIAATVDLLRTLIQANQPVQQPVEVR
ncbi:ribulose-phosphate 3-epimerase [Leptonema illini]|jgi:ribulose-phosphate 3-epimerase|uniref:Ribulose-phosphate 3-epimerase n=1 Tax=Leptonema illini DSM 21528 TaxID=929563 RepID=H2CI13_9LEPT|nr:ribulose-phosphate 3-epimerase [Leptonema illini]EHQ08036.1 ribulose-5-phosphate 3-epimerase [Leptonema illini DSM 21528]